LNLLKQNFELFFWIAALTALAFSDPTQTHYTLCPIKRLGFNWCPGCGMGHAIAWLFHGNIKASFHAHWFGVPALGILLYRIWQLSYIKYYRPAEAKNNFPFK